MAFFYYFLKNEWIPKMRLLHYLEIKTVEKLEKPWYFPQVQILV